MSATETDAPAEVLTIDEAATILRISRNAATVRSTASAW